MIINYDGTDHEYKLLDSSYRNRRIMGEDELTLYISTPEFVEIPLGATCAFEGNNYTLYKPQTIRKNGDRDFEIVLQMGSAASELGRYKIRNLVDKRLKFPMTAKPQEHIQLIVDNLNARGTGWTVGTCIDSTEKLVSYNHTSLRDALQMIADEFETEWQISGKTIHLRKVEYNKEAPLALSYGQGNGFKPGVGRVNSQETGSVEILYVQGGTRNIDYSGYGAKELLLPKSQTMTYQGREYITDADGYSIRRNDKALTTKTEDSLDCSHIYPSRTGTVSSVVEVNQASNLYDFLDSSIPAALDFKSLMIAGEKLTVKFDTGMLAGREFDVDYNHTERRFYLVPQELDGVTMPNATFKPAVGDKYGVFGMMLPEAYVSDNATETGASWDMFREGVRYLYEHEDALFEFTGEMDGIWAKLNWGTIASKIVLGGYVNFSDAQFQPGGTLIRITGIKDSINNPYSPTIELSNQPVSGTVKNQLGKVSANEVTADKSVNELRLETKRGYRETQETIELIKAAFDGFTSGITPLTVQTMALLVGDESLQYRFVNSKTTPTEVTHTKSFDSVTKKFSADPGIIQHMTLGLGTLQSGTRTAASYSYWDVAAFLSAELTDQATPYYAYVKASKTTQAATFVLSASPIKMEAVAGYYHFLLGFLNSEDESGERSFAPMYGFTEILPGRITSTAIHADTVEVNQILAQQIYSSGATIGGVDIDHADILSNNITGLRLGNITSFAPTAGQSGVLIGKQNGTYKFFVGNETNYITFTGDNLIISGYAVLGSGGTQTVNDITDISGLFEIVNKGQANQYLRLKTHLAADGEITSWADAGGYAASIWDAMPAASATVKGGIKVGSGLSIDANGVLSANVTGGVSDWADLTGKPTWLAYATLAEFQNGHTHSFSQLTSKPTTLSGYGITDAALATHNHAGAYEPVITKGTTAQYFRGDMSLDTFPASLPASDVYAWAKAATKPSYTFSEIGSKPTTLSGYGITDAAAASHAHTFTSLTSKPTTLSGYGITDAQAKLSGTGIVRSAAGTISYSTDNDIAYNGGVSKWVSTRTYYSGELVVDSDGVVWQAWITNTNDNPQPGTSANWAYPQLFAWTKGASGTVLLKTGTGWFDYAWSALEISNITNLQASLDAKLSANQTITVSGDATGSGATAISVTLANSGVTAGTYNNVATQVRPFTVDAKGRVTGIGTAITLTPAWTSVTGKPTTLAGYGITDAASLSHVGATGAAHGVATASVAGFMSASDKSLLDYFEIINPGTATEYIRAKTNFAADGEITAFGVDGYTPGSIWEAMPTASATTQGAIKVGAGLTIDANGVLSANVTSGGASSWSELTGKPTWLTYATLSEFQTGHGHAFSQITGKPTTLTGYGITDAAGLDANTFTGHQTIRRASPAIYLTNITEPTYYTAKISSEYAQNRAFTIVIGTTEKDILTASYSGGSVWIGNNTLSSSKIGIGYDNGTALGARLDVNGTGKFSGTVTAPTFAGNATSATNLAAGSAYSIPYQSASGTTAFLGASTAGYVLKTNSTTAAPAWGTLAKADVGLSAVENTALSTWAGTTSITTLGAIIAGTWNGAVVGIAYGGTGATTAASARTNLGATTVGGNLFTLTNPSAVAFPRFNADNTVSALDAASFRTAIGAGTSSTAGTVTSVAMAVPTGLSVTGTPITSSGTLALSLASGYSIPTTANQTNWSTAYTYSQVGHLPLAGGTLTGGLSGTTGTFSGNVSMSKLAVGTTAINPYNAVVVEGTRSIAFQTVGSGSQAQIGSYAGGAFFRTNAYYSDADRFSASSLASWGVYIDNGNGFMVRYAAAGAADSPITYTVPLQITDSKTTLSSSTVEVGGGVFDMGTGTASIIASHYYHRLYTGNNVYAHYYPSGGNGTSNTTANLRVWSGANQAINALVLNGSGVATWVSSATGEFVSGQGTFGNSTLALKLGSSDTTYQALIRTAGNTHLVGWRNDAAVGGNFLELGSTNLPAVVLSTSTGNAYVSLVATKYKIWHEGNANLSTVNWAANNFTASGSIFGSTSINQFVGQRAPAVGDLDLNGRLSDTQMAFSYTGNTSASTTANMFPYTTNANGILTFNRLAGLYGTQLAFSSNGNLYTRYNNAASWTAWDVLYTSRNANRSDVDWSTKSLTATGNILATGEITAYSDRRLKSDIRRISNAGAKMDSLNGYTFMKDGKRSAGVIAQEIRAVLPEAVIGTESATSYLSVNDAAITGLLIEAIKEQQREIRQLRTELNNYRRN